MSLEVRRAGDRFTTMAEGRTTRHSFSFGAHYDPGNVGFGAIVAHNDELLPPGTGYADHPHVETEIVTWVLEGALRHTDATGATGVLEAGDVQRISAGTGIVHAEVTEPGVRTRFLQTWLRPDRAGAVPSYARTDGAPEGTLTEVVGPAGLPIGVRGARLLVGPPRVLPDVARLHLFVVTGQVELDGLALQEGDEARLSDHGSGVLEASADACVAVWAFGR